MRKTIIMLLSVMLLASSFLYRQVYATTPASVFDIDGNGEVKPLSDGLLVLRYLFDFRGATLINNAIGAGATRTTATQIETYLNDNLSVFDIDGNGGVKPLSDGLLLLRYLFDFRGDTLINNAIGTGATRKTATAIDNYIVTGGIPDTERPAMTVLVSASSLDADKITLDWYAGSDNITPHSSLSYHLHISKNADFKPTTSTDKKQLNGEISGTVDGLQANTQYYAMIVTVDRAGNESWSNKLSVKTVLSVIKRTTKKIQVQTAAQNPVVTKTRVTFKKGAKIPAVGSYISSAKDKGYLRKVTAVSTKGDQVTATTEAASLNEIFEELEFSTTVKLQSPPQQAKANGSARAYRSKNKSGVQRAEWKKTNLTIIDPNTDIQKQLSNLSIHNTNSRIQGDLTVDGDKQTNENDVIALTGPAYVTADPGKQLEIKLTAKAWDKQLAFGRYKHIELCSIKYEGIKLNNKKVTTSPLPFVAFHNKVNDHKINTAIKWKVNKNHVTEEDHPYIATFTAYADKKGEGCNGDDYLGTWEDYVTIRVPIYVTMGSAASNDKKTVTFKKDFTVKDVVDFKFDPEFIINAKIKRAALQTATLKAQAYISLSNTLTITASASGHLKQKKTLVAPKQFIRVFTAGPVPIVVRGSFGMSIELEGNVQGKMELEKLLKIAIPNAEFGLKYDKNTGWTPVTNFKQEYKFSIKGEADASADIKLTLIPDLQIHFYEAASGRMLVEPYLYGEAGIHGQFIYNDTNGEHLTDLDYWFTKLEAGAGIDLRLYAGLHKYPCKNNLTKATRN